MSHLLKPSFVVLLFVADLPDAAEGQEWARFRGPNGSGVSEATTVPVRWSESDFNWRVRLPGVGHSSPVLWGRRVFLTAADEKTSERIALCLDAADGRVLWSDRFAGEKHRKHSLNSFASATPAADGERVYFCWASPERHLVQAYDHSGDKLWEVDLGPFQASHGAGVSPIVFDGRVFVGHENRKDSAIVALDAATGKTIWRVPRDARVSYVTPCVYRPAGRPAEIIFTNWKQGVTAVDPQTGGVKWERSVFDQQHVETSIASPIVHGDLVLGTCGWLGYATHTVAVRPKSGYGGVEIVYRVDRGAPLTTTPLVVNELLFLWADEGIVTCADADDGTVHWRRRVGGKYYGSPVAVGGAVYCLSTDGRAVVLAAGKDYKLLARNPVLEGSHSTPATAGSVMYLRTFSHLISIGGERNGER